MLMNCREFELVFRLGIGALEFAIMYLFVRNFFNRRDAKKWKPMLSILLFGVLAACVNILRLPYVNTGVLAVLFFLFAQLLFNGPWVQKAKLSIILIGISAISEIGISFITEAAMDFMQKHGIWLDESFAPAIASKVILFLLVIIITRIFPKKYNLVQSSNDSPWLLIFPILGVASMYVLLYFQQASVTAKSTMLPLAAFGLMIPLATLAPLLIYDSNLEKRRLESELKLVEERQQADDVFHRARERSLEEARRLSHDYKNNLINLQSLYRKGTVEADAYFNSLMDSLVTKGDPCPIEMGNQVASNIISRVRSQCTKSGIRFQLNMDCRELGFLKMLDTSSILDNALDNAMQACESLPVGKRRFITLSILERSHYVLIRVRNSKCNDVLVKDGKLVSTKQSGPEHGLGVENIRIAARKYGGDITYEYDADTFTVSARVGKNT